ncbi:MAG: glycosyl hydrolase [Bacillota bacterium]
MKKRSLILVMLVFLICFSGIWVFAAMLGDLNEDGDVNSLDFTLMRRYILDSDGDFSFEIADVNDDSSINSIDFSFFRRYLKGEIDEFPGTVDQGDGSSIIYAEPVTPDATEEAKALLNYLHTIYGEKMLSGQMESTWQGGPDYELDYVEQYSGKLPAIRGLDFIHSDDNTNVVQRAIEWWERGGIPTIMWHWGAPTIGEGYENSKETIDIEAALTPGTVEYEAMMSDLDRIADHLEVIRDADVPIIWRPFHEHNGGWFWWSKDGPEQFNELWRFMFDYFANERGLNNLIWVLGYSSNGDSAWYPGDEYVDIAGADTYDVGKEPLLKMFNSVRQVVGLDMPITYHENGVMPDPELSKEAGVHWSWFMTWHTTWLTESNSPEHIDYVYNHDYVLTLDELPDIMDYAGEGESGVAKIYTMVDGSGEIATDTDGILVDKGTSVTFTAEPDEGWEFVGWSGSSTSQSNPLEINVNDTVGLTATFTPLSGTNVLANGDFSDGMTHWGSYLFEDQGAVADISVVDGECVVNITDGGNELYHVQLIRPNVPLEEGEEYELSFDVYADSSRDMFLKVGEQGGEYQEYFGEEFTISSEEQTITKIFTMSYPTDENARIEFNIGLSTANVYIDNVSLSVVE